MLKVKCYMRNATCKIEISPTFLLRLAKPMPRKFLLSWIHEVLHFT